MDFVFGFHRIYGDKRLKGTKSYGLTPIFELIRVYIFNLVSLLEWVNKCTHSYIDYYYSVCMTSTNLIKYPLHYSYTQIMTNICNYLIDRIHDSNRIVIVRDLSLWNIKNWNVLI